MGTTVTPDARTIEERRRSNGLGVCCAKAQADGVPCFELGVECGECELGRELDARAPAAPTPVRIGG
jgi:hypothetical protein